ncbi:hypothetical protein NMY22_g4409 [Coprinellus aureogranulatus]|nr:hypothetical protein NMY22_g4409 [Coprinellus aureogranulatus]
MILLGQQFGVAKWFIDNCTSLVKGESDNATSLNLEEMAKSLGWETAARILWVRNTLQSFTEDVMIPMSQWKCPHCHKRVDGTGVMFPVNRNPQAEFDCKSCRRSLTAIALSPSDARGGIFVTSLVEERVRETFAKELKDMD